MPSVMPLDKLLVVLNVGAGVGANSEATSNAGEAPLSLERRTISNSSVAVRVVWGTWWKIANAA